MIESLQAKFGIPSAVAVAPGNRDMPKVVLSHPSGAGAEVYLHGAHVTSWKNGAGEELLFLSRQSSWAAGRPTRGGIPICFPQFSDQGPLPKHGMARTSEWMLSRAEKLASGDVAVTFRWTETDATLKVWPHRFVFDLRAELGPASLTLAAQVKNTGDRAFEFQIALHTYFALADIRRAAVCGLKGTTLLDDLRHGASAVEQRQEIRFDRETDVVYVNAPDSVTIRDEAARRTFSIAKSGMADVVVWNPWSAKAQAMPDFGDDEYLRMVCLETGNVATKLRLGPQEQWRGDTRLSAEAWD